MTFSIHCQLCSIVVLLITLYTFRSRRVINIPSFRTFHSLLLAVFFSVCMDTATICVLGSGNCNDTFIGKNLCKFYLMTIAIVAYLLLRYTVYQVRKRSTTAYTVQVTATVILVLYILSAMYLDLDYNIMYGQVYPYGPYVALTFMVALLSLVICIVYIINNRKIITRQKKNAIIFMMCGLFVAGTLQIFSSHLLFISFTMTAAMLYMYMCLEGPEEYIDRSIGIFNVDGAKLMLGNEWDNRRDMNLIAIKISNMNFINETFGNRNGTNLLTHVADFLYSIPDTFVFRSGGATFTLVVFGPSENCEPIIAQIKERFTKSFHVSDIDTLLKARICVLYATNDTISFDNKLDLVKYYMNESSSKNSNKVLEINQKTIQEKRMFDDIENALVKALNEDNLCVYYQPIFNNKKGIFTSAEALLRVTDAEGNFISPETFIPLAEKNGLILQLGMRMFEKVCEFINKNDLQNSQLDYIEVNLSVIQCMQHDLADRLLEVMERHLIDPSFINFEITETAASSSETTFHLNMEKLIQRNASFSLDDYGSGYSNINYVLELPINLLKYDKNMVWSSFETEKGRLVMEYTVNMVKELKLKSLAEGVETEEQFEKIKEMGIEYTQGYYFSKPLPEQEFLELITS